MARVSTRWTIAAWIAGGAAGAASFFGCVDLFHSTDFGTTVVSGPIDFCTWSRSAAHDHAVQACALLAACQSPVGDNAVGSCMVNATFAYDCSANASLPVTGKAYEFWDCMAHATSCGEVSSCVYSDPPSITSNAKGPTCDATQTSAFTACNGGTSSTRVDCQGSGKSAVGESCLASSRSCVPKKNGKAAICAGSEGVTCAKTGCNGTALDSCVDAGGGDFFDVGLDCASYGAGKCEEMDAGADAAPIGPGCVPVDAGACPPEPGVRCSGSKAESCATGFNAVVDCSALGDDVGCSTSTGAAAWDLTAACQASSPKCSADVCADGHLQACVRGSIVDVDCAGLGLGACTTITTSDGPRASCAAP